MINTYCTTPPSAEVCTGLAVETERSFITLYEQTDSTFVINNSYYRATIHTEPFCSVAVRDFPVLLFKYNYLKLASVIKTPLPLWIKPINPSMDIYVCVCVSTHTRIFKTICLIMASRAQSHLSHLLENKQDPSGIFAFIFTSLITHDVDLRIVIETVISQPLVRKLLRCQFSLTALKITSNKQTTSTCSFLSFPPLPEGQVVPVQFSLAS